MNRKRWLWCTGGLLLALVSAVIVWCWESGPIRFENVEKIKAGMTQAEVVALIGCDKGVYATVPVMFLKMDLADGSPAWAEVSIYEEHVLAGFEKNDAGESWYWLGDRGYVAVNFDHHKKVIDANMLRGRRSAPSPWWQFLERKLGLDS